MKSLLLLTIFLALTVVNCYAEDQDYTQVSGDQVTVSTDMGSGVSTQVSGSDVTVRFDN